MRRALLAVLIAVPLFAANPVITSIEPASGPSNGGTKVTLRGTFSTTAQVEVLFGKTHGLSVDRLDANTITVITPSHLPGEVRVVVIEDRRAGSMANPVFTFTGDPSAAFERILLPTFTEPANGAFGSIFDTTLRMAASSGAPAPVDVFGVVPFCAFPVCPWEPHIDPVHVASGLIGGSTAFPVSPPGRPGRFIYVRRSVAADLHANLRVADVTRSAQNYGTEIPVVREREFFEQGQIVLLGVPTDPRFRNTLRIYSTESFPLTVRINNEVRVITLTPGENMFEPAYGVIGDFPVNAGTIAVTIDFPAGPIGFPGDPPPKFPPTWAFIATTNNETQAITTISPQR